MVLIYPLCDGVYQIGPVPVVSLPPQNLPPAQGFAPRPVKIYATERV